MTRRFGSRSPLLSGMLLVALLAGLGGAGQEGTGLAVAAKRADGGRPSVPVEQLLGSAGSLRSAVAEDSDRRVTIPAGSRGSRRSRLSVIAGRREVALRNGGRVDLADGLSVELFVDPYPPSRGELWLDLHLTRTASGRPITSAQATMTYDMRIMRHGVNNAVVRNRGDGHYVATAHYPMFGEWGHRVRIRVGRTVHELYLAVGVVPG